MLSVRNLTVRYGAVTVVEDLTLALNDQEILMLVGPTGCGKTTILHALAGLVPIQNGEIDLGRWKISPVRQVPPEKRNVGMVFQDFALFPHLSVEENIGFRLKNRAPVERWLYLLGLEPLRRARPGTLSGGQKQRVALARALAHEPALMLLDEPLSNLDAALKDNLRWEIREVLKEAGVPAIWVTHDQSEALSVGDRVGVLNGGRLEQLDTPEACFCQPVSRFVAGFLGEASFVAGQLEQGVVQTNLGPAPGMPVNGASGEVDLLVRPDDCSLVPAADDGNARIEWGRYEGGSILYLATLDDGTPLKVRVSHESHLEPGERVSLRITTTHPLTAFARAGSRDTTGEIFR